MDDLLSKAAGFDPAAQEAQAFWKEVENYLWILENDPCAELLSLITHVNGFSPRERWILPILTDVSARDFRAQLLAALEDHRKEGA